MEKLTKTISYFFILIFLILIYFPGQTCAQDYWSKTYGGTEADEGHSVSLTSDGGFIALGTTKSFGAAGKDIWLMKSDVEGNSVWTKSFKYFDYNEAYQVIESDDGGFALICGSGYPWLIKTDAAGDTLWTKKYGAPNGGHTLYSILQTCDRGYIMAGEQGMKPWLLKTNSEGVEEWSKVYDYPVWMQGNFPPDGNRLHSVKQTNDKGFITVGYGRPADDWLSGMLVIRTGPEGDTLWTKIFHHGIYGNGHDVIITSDSCFIIAGSNISQVEDNPDINRKNNIVITKLDTLGEIVWEYKEEEGDFDKQARSIVETPGGGYVFTGEYYSAGSAQTEIFIKKLDEEAGIEWENRFVPGDLNFAYSVINDGAGGYIICGSSRYLSDAADLLLIRTDPQDNINNLDAGNSNRPTGLILRQNYPNPFNPATIISYSLPSRSYVELSVFDNLGREVKPLVSAELAAGSYKIEFKASDLPSGVYFYRLQTNNSTETKRMLLLK